MDFAVVVVVIRYFLTGWKRCAFDDSNVVVATIIVPLLFFDRRHNFDAIVVRINSISISFVGTTSSSSIFFE